MSWTQEQKSEFAKNYVLTCKLYDKQVDFDIARLVVNDLSDLNFEQCLLALVEYRKSDKNKFWPKSSDLRAIVQPKPDKREIATILARNIDRAVAKHGYTWSMGTFIAGNVYFLGGGKWHWTFKEAVIAELGEIAWHAICVKGGWELLRNSANEMDEGQFIAQLRDQIQSSYNLKEQGIDVTKIEMPEHKGIEYKENKNVLNLVNIKSIE